MQKFSILSFILISLIIISANGLKVTQSHETDLHFNMRISHLDQSDEFSEWLQKDKEFFSAHENRTKLSKDAEKRLKQKLKTYPNLLNEVLGLDKIGQCTDNFTPDQKNIFYGWILDQIDFSNIFVEDARQPSLTEQQQNKIIQKAKGNKPIMNKLTPCMQ